MSIVTGSRTWWSGGRAMGVGLGSPPPAALPRLSFASGASEAISRLGAPMSIDDGTADLVVWRPSDGSWYGLTSSSGFTAPFFRQWGLRGDIPVGGFDVDRDGIADLVVWRPSDGGWYGLTSSSALPRFSSAGPQSDIWLGASMSIVTGSRTWWSGGRAMGVGTGSPPPAALPRLSFASGASEAISRLRAGDTGRVTRGLEADLMTLSAQ